jgi:hypothetical protein
MSTTHVTPDSSTAVTSEREAGLLAIAEEFSFRGRMDSSIHLIRLSEPAAIRNSL